MSVLLQLIQKTTNKQVLVNSFFCWGKFLENIFDDSCFRYYLNDVFICFNSIIIGVELKIAAKMLCGTENYHQTNVKKNSSSRRNISIITVKISINENKIEETNEFIIEK